MVMDTSALLAVLFAEPTAEHLRGVIAADPRRLLSSVSSLEAHLVTASRKADIAFRALDALLHRIRIETVGFSAEQSEIAHRAWSRYGKGRHQARLNLGDCCAYALARWSGEPLLYVGDDFAHTDVASVL